MRRWVSLLGVASTGAVLAGCGASSPQTIAAHKIADALPRAIGPAGHYDVHVEGDPLALTRGRAQRVLIAGEDVQAAPETTLDTLTLDARDVSFDTGKKQLERIARADFTVTVGQQHLTQYLAQSKPLLPGLTVTLLSDSVEAQVPVTVASLRTTAALTGTFAPSAAGPDKVDFVAQRARVGVVPLPAPLVNLALHELNPLMDLSTFRVPVAVQQAGVSGGKLYVRGTADLNALKDVNQR